MLKGWQIYIWNYPSPLPASPGPVGTMVVRSPSVDQLTVAWAPPTTGGVPTSYNVSINDSSSPVIIPDNGSSLYTHTFTGLTSDTLYTVSVVAINCAGTSNVTSMPDLTCKCIDCCQREMFVICGLKKTETCRVLSFKIYQYQNIFATVQPFPFKFRTLVPTKISIWKLILHCCFVQQG